MILVYVGRSLACRYDDDGGGVERSNNIEETTFA